MTTRWLLLGLLLVMTPVLAARSPQELRGLEIAEEMDRRDRGWSDQRADMLMVLRNRRGQESRREIRVQILEVDGDGDRSLIVFDSPGDVKGTALLTFTHALVPDEQWLYLPALKRVKRISSASKSGPFMGSEFAYEDLTSQEVEKYHYRWLGDQELAGRAAMVLERTPRYQHSGYTRQVVWVDAEIWRPLKVEFYDRKNALLKTLTIHGYRPYLDAFWRADSMRMVNHQSGKSTELLWSNYRHRSGLTAADFDRNALKRAR